VGESIDLPEMKSEETEVVNVEQCYENTKFLSKSYIIRGLSIHFEIAYCNIFQQNAS
jgi:hypothetical protein